MTADFGDFANMNPERIMKQAQEQAAKMVEVQEQLQAVEGKAESQDGFVKATYTATGGLVHLEFNPRAMRMASSDLADTVKNVIREAAEDLQRRIREQMSDVFAGQDNPMDLINDPDRAVDKIKDVQSMLNGAVGDAYTQMERLRKQLGL